MSEISRVFYNDANCRAKREQMPGRGGGQGGPRGGQNIQRSQGGARGGQNIQRSPGGARGGQNIQRSPGGARGGQNIQRSPGGARGGQNRQGSPGRMVSQQKIDSMMKIQQQALARANVKGKIRYGRSAVTQC